MERKTFLFYKEWRDAIKDLPDDVRLELYDSIMEYAFTGEIEGLKPMASIAFNFIRPTIDRDTAKYISKTEANRENGNKGGRPRSTNPINPQKPSGFIENPKNLVHDNDYDNGDTKVSSPLTPQGEGGGDFLSSCLSQKDGIARNLDGLCAEMKRLKISQKDQDIIMKMSNFGQIGNPVWTYISQCVDSIGKSTFDKSRIKIPGRYIISKLKEEKKHGT